MNEAQHRCLTVRVAAEFVASAATAQAQYGPMMTGAGPIKRSMADASTALPLDTLGAFMWNPATLTGLPNSADIGLKIHGRRLAWACSHSLALA
ncbi:MAG: hypothetical protein ACO3NZ_09885 [Pirellulales bacterium]|jgi:hypothetical protein